MMNMEYDKISTRDAFGNGLLRAADKYDNLVYVAADTLKSVGGAPMYKKYPERTLNVGIAEQNMALMGAGMASCGAKAVVASYATFCSMRICEQIRTFVCYPNLDVKIVAGLGGMSGAQEGVTHQGIEDIGVLRSIPNLAIVEVADAASTEVITDAIMEYEGPVYLRLGRVNSPKVFDENYKFTMGKANVMKAEGQDAAIITTGLATIRAKQAVEKLEELGYSVRLIEMPCIKPIDAETIVQAAETGCVITVEDHNVIGGLGSTVTEVLSEKQPTYVLRIGIEDTFTESGDHEELMDAYNLSVESIVEKTVKAISKTNIK